LSENSAKKAVIQGALKDRPIPRLLQQLYRKKFTGYFVVADQTGDESEVYLRGGTPVHVRRPVDTDRLDNLLVEYGVVPAEVVATASAQVSDGQRLGDVLARMGALDKQRLAQVLKSQVVRKLTRLFFVAEGTYAVFVASHAYGEGADLTLMRVDPRSVIYPGIRAAYDLPRVTQELTRLLGLRFRMQDLSAAFITAMGIAPDDPTVDALRKDWMTLDDLDAVTSRPLEVRSVVLALYYSDLLEREPISQPMQASDSAIPRAVLMTQSSDVGVISNPLNDSGPEFGAVSDTTSPGAPEGSAAAVAPAPEPRPAPSPPSAVYASSAPKPFASAGSKRPSGIFAPVQASPAVAPVPAAPMVVPPASPIRTDAKSAQAATRATIQDMAQKLDKANHFELLGVSQAASSDEIGVAFVRAARQFHPDRLMSAGLQDLQPLAEKILARINESAMVLGNATRRAEYVSSLAAGPRSARTTLPTLLEAENMFLKGEVFLKKGEHAKAVECFTSACAGNPGEPQYRAYLAWARFDDPHARKETLVRETLKTMEEVLRERPKFVRGFYWVGLLWKFLNETDKAERAFREVMALDTSFIDAGRELRLIEMRKAKPAQGKAGSKPEPPRSGGFMGKFFKK
jgi:tetratricopeptide (TPR) repeat protein